MTAGKEDGAFPPGGGRPVKGTDGAAKKKRLNPVLVKVYMSAEEKAEVAAAAVRLGLSVSEYVRRLATRYEIPGSRIEASAVRELSRVNADQARLGNLLLAALDALGSSRVSTAFIERTRKLYDKVRGTQKLIRACVLEISGRG